MRNKEDLPKEVSDMVFIQGYPSLTIKTYETWHKGFDPAYSVCGFVEKEIWEKIKDVQNKESVECSKCKRKDNIFEFNLIISIGQIGKEEIGAIYSRRVAFYGSQTWRQIDPDVSLTTKVYKLEEFATNID